MRDLVVRLHGAWFKIWELGGFEFRVFGFRFWVEGLPGPQK